MPFALALAFSALLHAAAIVMPGWDLPGAGEPDAVTLEAHLASVPKPSAPAIEKVKPRPLPTKKTAPVAVPTPAAAIPAPAATAPLPVAEPLPTSAQAAAVPVVEAPPPVAAVPPPPPAAPWPRQGRMRYAATYGEGGLVIGETVQEWRIDAGQYSIRSVFAPKGLAAMFGKTRAQASEGEVTAEGLRPHQFRDQREGRAEESASFDWATARAVFSGGRGESRLTPGTQDMVSVFYQLAWLAPRQDVSMAVATASRLGRWTFEWLGEEQLSLGVGVLSTLHLRTRADGDTTEVWLAPTHGGLPVKIRHIDRRGDVFEQAADLLEPN